MKTSLLTIFTWFLAVTGISVNLNAQNPGPKLNSLPSASPTIFLDFDGQTVVTPYWNGGSPIVAASPNFTDDQITFFFNKVAEDYRPFNINITTDSTVYFAAPTTRRMRVIVTPTYQWYGLAGGVSYVGSFSWGINVPAFVFSNLLANDPNLSADAASHEAGHTLGLNHQSTFDANCNVTSEYNSGSGTGETSWAPIMGKSYYKTLSTWYNGPSSSLGCNSKQDDMSIIANSATNGTGYRPDDVGDTKKNSTPLSFTQATQSFNSSGIVNTNTDVDFYSVNMPVNGNFKFNAAPYTASTTDAGANLYVKLSLYKQNGTLIKTYSSASGPSAKIDTTLTAGTYYVSVENTSSPNSPSNYGLVGGYTMEGSYIVSSGLPIYSLVLSGTAENSEHQLSWNIVADEPIESITVENSKDGQHFNTLYVLNGDARKYTNKPFDNTPTAYRLKAVTAAGATYYSNTITLKGVNSKNKITLLSNNVSNELTVLSDNNYQYRVFDMSGKTLATGRMINGTNHISMVNAAKGLYFIQVEAGEEKITQRFIKQ